MKGKCTLEPDSEEHTNKLLKFVSKRRKLKMYSTSVLRDELISFWIGARKKLLRLSLGETLEIIR